MMNPTTDDASRCFAAAQALRVSTDAGYVKVALPALPDWTKASEKTNFAKMVGC